jgi:hypothetical protein
MALAKWTASELTTWVNGHSTACSDISRTVRSTFQSNDEMAHESKLNGSNIVNVAASAPAALISMSSATLVPTSSMTSASVGTP